MGLATFYRVLQSASRTTARRPGIARLRGYYLENAPDLTAYLLSVSPAERLGIQGLGGGPWQGFLTVAGMVAVITAGLARSAAVPLGNVSTDHWLTVALAAGAVVAVAVLVALMRFQDSAWKRAGSASRHPDEGAGPR